jgi:hypothetical protein
MSTPEGYRLSHCRSCGAEIVWAATNRNTYMPVDIQPTADGNVELQPDGNCIVYRGPIHRPLHLSHFVTCPDRAKWKR